MRTIAALILLGCIASCKPGILPPKPPGYYKIDTPATHSYQVFDRAGFPYSFEYPAYGTVEDDTMFKSGTASNKYWINIKIDTLGAVINLTYKPVTKEETYQKLMEASWGLSFMHHEKADYIDQREGINPNGVLFFTYTVGGNTASRYQFAATDTVKHFLRGALYFDVSPNADSLKPANDFLEKDIAHMLETLKWKN